MKDSTSLEVDLSLRPSEARYSYDGEGREMRTLKALEMERVDDNSAKVLLAAIDFDSDFAMFDVAERVIVVVVGDTPELGFRIQARTDHDEVCCSHSEPVQYTSGAGTAHDCTLQRQSRYEIHGRKVEFEQVHRTSYSKPMD